MTDIPRDPNQADSEDAPEAPDASVQGEGHPQPEPRSFGGANQGADAAEPDYGNGEEGAQISADDAGASAMAERAANDVERP